MYRHKLKFTARNKFDFSLQITSFPKHGMGSHFGYILTVASVISWIQQNDQNWHKSHLKCWLPIKIQNHDTNESMHDTIPVELSHIWHFLMTFYTLVLL